MVDISPYLDYVSGSPYPRIVVIGDGTRKTNIEYVELRPDCDVLCVAGREVSLSSLTGGLDGGRSFTYAMELTAGMLEGRTLGFDIGSEGARIGRVELDNKDLLAIGELEKRLDGMFVLTRRRESAA